MYSIYIATVFGYRPKDLFSKAVSEHRNIKNINLILNDTIHTDLYDHKNKVLSSILPVSLLTNVSNRFDSSSDGDSVIKRSFNFNNSLELFLSIFLECFFDNR